MDQRTLAVATVQATLGVLSPGPGRSLHRQTPMAGYARLGPNAEWGVRNAECGVGGGMGNGEQSPQNTLSKSPLLSQASGFSALQTSAFRTPHSALKSPCQGDEVALHAGGGFGLLKLQVDLV